MPHFKERLFRNIFISFVAIMICATIALAASAVKLFDTVGVPRGIKMADDGSQDVNLQDQTTRPLIIKMSQLTSVEAKLAVLPVVGEYDVTLVAGHGVIEGESVTLHYEDPAGEAHYMLSQAITVATNLITLDEPIPYAFPIEDTFVVQSVQNMNLNGSVVGGGTKVFSLTHGFTHPVDITEITFHITDATDMDDGLFGGISALTRGIVLRKAFAGNGHYENIFNVKSNGEFGELSGPADKAYDTKAPAGVYGYTTKINFGGQGHMGVVIRLNYGDSIQILVQDDLTGLLTMTAMVLGHFTD